MKIQKTIGGGIMSLGLIAGLTSFAGASPATIRTTGPDSNNVVTSHMTHKVHIMNDNYVNSTVHNDQHSSSGDATTRHNTKRR